MKHIFFAAAFLAQGLALHALTESDLSTLDAAFEATFRESPSGGLGVWTDPAKVPTNYTEWAYSLTTRTGCLGRFRLHLPQGLLLFLRFLMYNTILYHTMHTMERI